MKFVKWITKDIIHALSLLSYLGFLIEKYFFKSTILFIVLVIIGVISGFYNAYVAIMRK